MIKKMARKIHRKLIENGSDISKLRHDLTTPLTVIKCDLDLFDMSTLDKKNKLKLRRLKRTINSQIKKMVKMLRR